MELEQNDQKYFVKNPKREQQISATFKVWAVSIDGNQRRKLVPGDDPT